MNADRERETKYRSQVSPCPFCGKPPVILASGERERGLMIICMTRDCVAPSVSHYDHKSSLAAWNRREVLTTPDRPRAEE